MAARLPTIRPVIIDTAATPTGRPFRLGVLSDSHRYGRPAAIPEDAIERLGACDAYLHCGDFMRPDLLEPLRARGPVYAVRGNVDPPDLGPDYPEALLLRIAHWRVGAVHAAGTSAGAWRRCAARFPERPDVLCFGHSHRPVAEEREGQVFLNPGSAVDPRGLPARSVATLELGEGLRVHLLKLP